MFLSPPENPPLWEAENAAVLRAFLESGTGQKVMGLLAFSAPVLLDGSHVNKTLVRSGEVNGYAFAVSVLVALQTSRPAENPAPSEEYPDLDNDRLWTDGEAEPVVDHTNPNTN